MMAEWNNATGAEQGGEFLYGVSGENGEVITRHMKAKKDDAADEKKKPRTAAAGRNSAGRAEKKAVGKKKKEEERVVSIPQVVLVAENARLRRQVGCQQVEAGLHGPSPMTSPTASANPHPNPGPSAVPEWTPAAVQSEPSPQRAAAPLCPDKGWKDSVAETYDRLAEEYLRSQTTPDVLKDLLSNESERLHQHRR
eukprot:TRINITY_DN7930_c0_g1_i3.p1 TRINITY_DN7930_c0_g1~~TRINITY_DN7930_c0_g1_i3.p1  ORF type:complete len:196 (-),score=53.98 TRINITY_DN7930_c0_g1_i3:271-858(-)